MMRTRTRTVARWIIDDDDSATSREEEEEEDEAEEEEEEEDDEDEDDHEDVLPEEKVHKQDKASESESERPVRPPRNRSKRRAAAVAAERVVQQHATRGEGDEEEEEDHYHERRSAEESDDQEWQPDSTMTGVVLTQQPAPPAVAPSKTSPESPLSIPSSDSTSEDGETPERSKTRPTAGRRAPISLLTSTRKRGASSISLLLQELEWNLGLLDPKITARYGQLAWARRAGFPCWPVLILDPRLLPPEQLPNALKEMDERHWVLLYGTREILQILFTAIVPWENDALLYRGGHPRGGTARWERVKEEFTTAVDEALDQESLTAQLRLRVFTIEIMPLLSPGTATSSNKRRKITPPVLTRKPKSATVDSVTERSKVPPQAPSTAQQQPGGEKDADVSMQDEPVDAHMEDTSEDCVLVPASAITASGGSRVATTQAAGSETVETPTAQSLMKDAVMEAVSATSTCVATTAPPTQASKETSASNGPSSAQPPIVGASTGETRPSSEKPTAVLADGRVASSTAFAPTALPVMQSKELPAAPPVSTEPGSTTRSNGPSTTMSTTTANATLASKAPSIPSPAAASSSASAAQQASPAPAVAVAGSQPQFRYRLGLLDAYVSRLRRFVVTETPDSKWRVMMMLSQLLDEKAFLREDLRRTGLCAVISVVCASNNARWRDLAITAQAHLSSCTLRTWPPRKPAARSERGPSSGAVAAQHPMGVARLLTHTTSTFGQGSETAIDVGAPPSAPPVKPLPVASSGSTPEAVAPTVTNVASSSVEQARGSANKVAKAAKAKQSAALPSKEVAPSASHGQQTTNTPVPKTTAAAAAATPPPPSLPSAVAVPVGAEDVIMTSQDTTADSSDGSSGTLETTKARRAAQLAVARLAKKARRKAASEKSQPVTGVPSGVAPSAEEAPRQATTTPQEVSPSETPQSTKAVAPAAVAVAVTEASSRTNDHRPSAPDAARVTDAAKPPARRRQGGSVATAAAARRKATPPKPAALTPPSQAVAKPTVASPVPTVVPPTVAASATTTSVTPPKPQQVATSISAGSSTAAAPPRPTATNPQRSVVATPALPPAASAPAAQDSSSTAPSSTNGPSTSSLPQVTAARRTPPPTSDPGAVPSASPTIRPALGELDWQDRLAKQPADASAAAAAAQQQKVMSAFRAATLAAEQAVASRRRSLSSADATAAAPSTQPPGDQSTTTSSAIEQSAPNLSSAAMSQASQSTPVAARFAGYAQGAPTSTQSGQGQAHQSASGTPTSHHHNAPQQPPSAPASTTGTGVAVTTVAAPVATVTRSNPSLVIFNKDGTLFDFQTTWIGWIESQAWRLEAAVGKPIRELFFDAMGYNWQSRTVRKDSVLSTIPKHELGTKIATEFLIGQGVPHADAARLIKEHWSLPKEASTYRPREDLAALFRTINALGIKIAIVTSDQREVTEKILTHLGVESLVDLVSCGDDGLPTNRPERIWAVCSRLGVSTSNTILVGDTADDMVLGRSAGCVLSIGVLGGAGSLADLAADADFLVPSVNNVIKVLFQYRQTSAFG